MIKRLIPLSLLCSVFWLTPLVAHGQMKQIVLPMDIELIGDADQLTFTETTDPGFLHTDAFLPGESIQRTLVIKNQKSVSFRLSFAIEPLSAREEFDILEQIEIQVFEDDKQLCHGIISENPCATKQLYATLDPGEERHLTMIATFNENAGNEYKNKEVQYDWIFDAIVDPSAIPIPPLSLLPSTGMYSFEFLLIGSVLVGSYFWHNKRQSSKAKE